jgi:hypothetical protein
MTPAGPICLYCRRPLVDGRDGLCPRCVDALPTLEELWAAKRLRPGPAVLWQRARFVVHDGPHAGLRGRTLWVVVNPPAPRAATDVTTGAAGQTEWEYETHLVAHGFPMGVASSLVELLGTVTTDVDREAFLDWIARKDDTAWKEAAA